MEKKQPKFGKLLRNNPGVYLGIFIFILFEACVGLIVMLIVIPKESKSGGSSSILPAILTSGILFAIGIRGVYKYNQYKHSDEYKKEKQEIEKSAKQFVNNAMPLNKPSTATSSAAPAKIEFQPYTGTGVCDVCSKPLSGRRAWIVPNILFYTSPQYQQWVNKHMNPYGTPMDSSYFVMMLMKDKSPGSAVCEDCIHMFGGKPAAQPSVQKAAPKATGPLTIYLDIDKLGGGLYGYEAGKAVAEAAPASLMGGVEISSGDSNATLYGSMNEYAVRIKGSDSKLDAIEDKLRASDTLKGLLSSSGIRRGNVNEPMVYDGTVQNGTVIGSNSWCAQGFNDIWKKTE